MVSLIVAIAKDNAIGKDNKLLFNIKEDLNFFKATTINKTIIMGRKTFESLPGVLPLREHIVITRDDNYMINHQQVKIKNNLIETLNEYKNLEEEVFVIGGGEIYKQALESGLVDRMYITKVDKIVSDSDTFFPEMPSYNYIVSDTKVLTEEAVVYIYDKID